MLLGVFPLFLIDEADAAQVEETGASGFFSFASKAPMLLAAVVAFAVFDAATLSLVPIYGLQTGLSLPTATNALTALIVGNVFLQFPIGCLADKFSKRLVLGACAMVAALFAAVLPLVMATPWMWPVLIIVGAAGYGVYTVSLASLGDRFMGHELVTGSSAFATMWGVGALTGSVAGGWSMASFGPHGLPLLVVVTYAMLVAGLIVRNASQPASESRH